MHVVSYRIGSPEFYAAWQRAISIPELGGGGAVVAPELVRLASEVPHGQCIVETGPWMGSTTAYLAIGASMNDGEPIIHSYDLWMITADFAKKALKYNGLTFHDGQDVKRFWKQNVSGFYRHIIGHQGNAYWLRYTGGPIGLLVDDCTSGAAKINALFENFGLMLEIGCAIVMMDYYFVEARPDGREYHETVEWFAAHPEFMGPARIGKSPAAEFVYRGSD